VEGRHLTLRGVGWRLFCCTPRGLCMANGKNAVLNLQGKVDASSQLVVVSQAVSGTPRTGTLGNLVAAVDASNRLVVTFG
jgi:hypothetical protein